MDRVAIRDEACQREVEKNFDQWLKSPMSLLFFRNIRRLQIGDRTVQWDSRGPGPIPESEWMALDGHGDDAFLLVRSDAVSFPEEALDEIKQERMLGVEEVTEFPPCRIEIVMGAKGRLFVVLPTGVETELPFACNAPLIQDPARLKIKDPTISPTNRWLLQRAGQLAASAMLNWLGQSGLPVEERAIAYGLFPDVNRDNSSLERVCGTIVEEAFEEAIEGRPLLLTTNGHLTPANKSVGVPVEIAAIWPPGQAAALLDEKKRPALCQQIKTADCKKLLHWGVIEEINKWELVDALQGRHLPKPKTWRHLLNLWAYIAPELTGYGSNSAKDVRIMPVQGKNVLYAAAEVVRLGEKKLLQSDDWEFLAAHMIVLNQNWPRFLAEERRTAADQKDVPTQQAVGSAYAVLRKATLRTPVTSTRSSIGSRPSSLSPKALFCRTASDLRRSQRSLAPRLGILFASHRETRSSTKPRMVSFSIKTARWKSYFRFRSVKPICCMPSIARNTSLAPEKNGCGGLLPDVPVSIRSFLFVKSATESSQDCRSNERPVSAA